MISQTTGRKLLLFGVPLLLGILEIFHPIAPAEGVFEALAPHATWWTVLHILQLPLFALLAIAMVLLVDGIQSRGVWVIRIAMLSFIVFYGALDSIAGIANGIVVQTGLTLLPEHHQVLEVIVYNLFASPVVFALSLTGALSWVIGVGTAAVLLVRRGVPRSAAALLFFGGFLFGYSHAPPLGPLGLFLLLGAIVWIERRPRSVEPLSYQFSEPTIAQP